MELTWSIYRIQSFPLLDGRQNVVSIVSWNATGQNDDGVGAVSGVVMLKISDLSNFVPYEQLMQAQIIEWTKESLGETKIKSIERQIEIDIKSKKQKPKIGNAVQETPLPWATQE